mmetsp:Transcript_10190/g.17109  ORF Transcript_10190/g.17109 Transcript_10190/m.17109 type:complete len:702 (+) Transcript_10190:143-2248(+)
MIAIVTLFLCVAVTSITAQCPASSRPLNTAAPLLQVPFVDFLDSAVANWAFVSVENVGCSTWTLLQESADNQRPTQKCHSGTSCFATGAKTYASNENSALVIGPFNFTTRASPHVTFWASINTVTQRDGFTVEISTDNGQSWTDAGTSKLYGNSQVLRSGSFVPALSSNDNQWKQYDQRLTGGANQDKVWIRFHFTAAGNSPATGGVLIDDVIVSAAPLPACPEVLSPEQGAFLGTLPNLIKWTEVPYVQYYDIQFARDSNFSNVEPIGAGEHRQWTTPPLFPGVYTYSVTPRRLDGTRNYWCPQRSFVAQGTPVVNKYAYSAPFDSAAFDGWTVEKTDAGKFVVKSLAGHPTAVGLAGSTYKALSYAVLTSPPFDFRKLPAATLTVDIFRQFQPNDGMTLQFSNDRGLSWHSLGAQGAGENWFNAASLPAFANFQGAGRVSGWGGSAVTWTRATYNLNAGSLSAFWVPCHPEVYFRFAIATGFSAGAGMAGGAFDNFRIGPDLDMKGATCGGQEIPEITPLSLTGAPTPWPPRRVPTTTSTTTEATTTLASTTLEIITPPPTPMPTEATTNAPTSVSVSAPPGTTGASQATTSAPTLQTEAPVSLSFETRTFPPVVPETTPPTTTDPDIDVTGTIKTSMNGSPSGYKFPAWLIAVIIVLALLLCCIIAALAAFIKNKKDKDDEADRNEDEELARPLNDSR